MWRSYRERWRICSLSLPISTLFFIVAAGLPSSLIAEQIPPVIVTCLGDSVTAGAGSGGPEYTYPAQLAVLLHEYYYALNIDVLNRGVGGYRAENVRSQLQNEGLPENPDFVLLKIGGNDIAATMSNWSLIGQVIDETVVEVQDCIDLVKAHTNPDGSHPTLIISTFMPNRLEESAFWGSLGTLGIKWYNDDLKADLTGYDLMIETNWEDFWQAYGLYGRANPSLMADSVHPNATGYGIMAENWLDAIGTFPSMKDSDNDGLTDAREDANGNGVWDAGEETDFNDQDTDNDGIGDLIELTCAGLSTALDPNARPGTIRVNFQPFRVVTTNGYLLDGGHTFTTATGYGW